ncbi:HD domain-containing protein [Selenomonas sp. TAMA-11512]|uniref:HD domain-containing protein n=1 Tax=Selenomonas sp. TAMA-11512 TaxID=3095337 RepID=UPI0030885A7A|nr:HD domain-containing protein [Selenomonas sp. TAMA-11512]
MQDLLREMHQWMHDYMRSFYTDDEEVQKGIVLKEEHTGYVTSISKELAGHLGLSLEDRQLAEIIGLFHDVGRFRQFSVYRTFNDAKSEDHAALGLQVLEELPFLKEMPKASADIVRFAILWHNKKEIQGAKSRRQLFFAKLIRDADKLDIYRVLRPFLTAPTDEGISRDFVTKFRNGEQVDYTKIRTQEDRKLVRLMWVYDINFAWTLKKVAERGYVADIIKELPKDKDVEEGVRRLLAYVEKKCAQPDVAEL